MNSLASTMSGPSGSSSSVAYQLTGHPSLAKSASLCRNHDGACLDERDRDDVEEFRHCTPGAERIGHQGAAPRTKLGDGHGAWLAHRLPNGHGPQADQLAEDLADLRCGDEVAVAADRLA